MTVLVTGGAGFAGSHLLRALAESDPSRAIVAWRRPNTAAPGHADSAGEAEQPRLSSPSSVQWEDVDVLDRAQVERAITDHAPREIYHCAGAANVRGSWTDTSVPLAVNVRGTQHLLEAVRDASLPSRVLIPGSALVYRPSSQALKEDDPIGPVSPYGVSKLAQEMLGRQCAETGMDVVVTRSFTHLGPGQALAYAASSFANQIARIEAGLAPPVIEVGSLDAERDLTDVRDTVQGYMMLMARGEPGQPYNVCSGKSQRIGTVLEGLLRHTTCDVSVETDPSRLRPRDNDRLLGDPSRIASDTGWRPCIPLDVTLRDLLDYWRRAIRPA